MAYSNVAVDVGSFFFIEKDCHGYDVYGFVVDMRHGYLEGNVESRMECKDGICHLYHLDVKKGSRRRGVGSSVIKAAEDVARDIGVSMMDVTIGWEIHDDDYCRSSELLRVFFEKNGYERGHFSRKESIERRNYAMYEYRKELE